jgi:hypothetical protein
MKYYFPLLSISIPMLFFNLLVMVNNTSAQSIDFGISSGINISSHINNFKYSSGDINLDLEPKITMGYQGGVIIRKNVTQSLRFQAEPSVIMLGASYEEPFTLRGFELQTDSKTELMYLQLPFLFQLSTVPPEENVFGRKKARTTFHLTGGVFGGYLLDAQFSGTNTGAPIGVSFEGDFSNNVTSQYAEYNGGVIFGGGFEHGQSNKIGFETRAQLAVIDSENSQEQSFTPQNIAITFSVYFLF